MGTQDEPPKFNIPPLAGSNLAIKLTYERLAGRARLYPVAPIDDLSAQLATFTGVDWQQVGYARYGCASLMASDEPLSDASLDGLVAGLCALDTKARFTEVQRVEGGYQVTVEVYTRNPHGSPKPRTQAVTSQLKLGAPTRTTCDNCGAVHVIFVSRKFYPGQERDDHEIACLACCRTTIEILGVADTGGYAVYLASHVPSRTLSAEDYKRYVSLVALVIMVMILLLIQCEIAR